MDQRLSKLQHFMLDLDGTIYLGDKLFPGAKELLHLLKEQGKNFLFLTNNSSRSVNEHAEKLIEMGIDIEPSDVLTPAEVIADYIKSQSKGERLFLLATNGFRQELEKRSLKIVDENPDYVVLGLDTGLTYEKLKKACLFIHRGVKFIASHPDKISPSPIGPLIECGALAQAITAATGVEPKILGKPHQEMIEAALKREDAKPQTTAIVGDCLYTDMKMGKDFGLITILLLTGETTRKMIKGSSPKPDFIFDSIADLKKALQNG